MTPFENLISSHNAQVLGSLLERMKSRSMSVQDFWRFLFLCFDTPRPSTNYDGIDKPARSLPFRNAIRRLCDANELEYDEDETGNMIIRNCPGKKAHVCFQGHMDVVVSKNETVEHDFETQGVDVQLTERNTVKPVKGITLGADNGVAIAGGLAVLVNYKDIPMELLVTTNEETSFDGACGLDASKISADVMLNLDSEVESAICVGSAGGYEQHFQMPIERESAMDSSSSVYSLKIKDLKGGHSGIDIDKEKCNAVFVMHRILLATKAPFQMVEFNGGTSSNAIPRECTVVLTCDDLAIEEIKSNFEVLRKEIVSIEDSVRLIVEPVEMQNAPLSASSTRQVVHLLSALPNGVVRRVPATGDIESSLNLGIARLDSKVFTCKYLVRSTSISWMKYYADLLASVGDLAGAKVGKLIGFFGAWEPDYSSAIVSKLKKTHFDPLREPKVYTVHAGLECSTIVQRFQAIGRIVECASIGPQIDHAHSPDECLWIESAVAFVDWIEALVRTF